MKKKPYFPILESEISKNGVMKKEIAKHLGISQRALSCKLTGKIDFWWHEICVIRSFFPDFTAEELFSH